jgi:hypothetical protein
MPLLPGKKEIGHNIGEMESAGHDRAQSIAAALNVARKHRAQGGVSASEAHDIAKSVLKEHIDYPAPKGHKGLGAEIRAHRAEGGVTLHKPKFHTKMHTGPIHSSVAGRTDHLPMHVPSGSYVLPADILSAGGEGNTIAGFKHAKRVFGGNPYGGSGATPYGQGKGPYGMAKGGTADSDGSGVPIVAAGGEYVIHPDSVREVGGGNLDTGHKVLDEFVKRIRKELIGTLKNLPGPQKD